MASTSSFYCGLRGGCAERGRSHSQPYPCPREQYQRFSLVPNGLLRPGEPGSVAAAGRAAASSTQSTEFSADPENESSGTPGTSASSRVWEVLLYAPNLVDYLRVCLALVSFALLPPLPRHARVFVALYALNFALDGLDGILARRLNQRSTFGALVDVVIDNSIRALMWQRALPHHWVGALLPCVEWIVLACTHSQGLSAAVRERQTRGPHAEGEHDWRESFSVAPWWVRAVMANGFKNPAGCLAIAGIHFLPLWVYINAHCAHIFPLLSHASLGLVLGVGRALGLALEVYVIKGHLSELLLSDAHKLDLKHETHE